MSKQAYVYILTNKNNTVLYTGVTNNLTRRLLEHKHKVNKCFTSRYNVYKLVYYETHSNIRDAIYREKKIKKKPRFRKNLLIDTMNQEWRDLSNGVF
jgi:putative endonuclease